MIYDIYLAARNSSRLNDFSKDIAVRTNKIIKTIDLDILDYPSHQGFYDNLDEKPLGVICAVGYLGEQSTSQTSFDEEQPWIARQHEMRATINNLFIIFPP